MESRIILSTADFSANNIGRYVELRDLTKKVLAKQTEYEEGSNQSVALDTFLGHLLDNGYLGGTDPIIKHLVIPALASSHDELLYNIAELDASGYPTNIMREAEITAENKLLLVDKSDNVVQGLKIANQTSTTFPTSSDYSGQNRQIVNNVVERNVVWPSLSCCIYLKALPANKIVRLGAAYQFQIDTGLAGIKSDNTSAISVTAPLNNLGAGFVGISYDSTEHEITGLLDNGTIGETSVVGSMSGLKTIDANSYNYLETDALNYNTNLRLAYSLLVFGKLMTSEQMAQFKSYVDTFMNELGIKEQ